MSQRVALVALTAASLLALVTFVVDVSWGPVLFAVVAVIFPVALMVVGAARRGTSGRELLPISLLLGVLFAVVGGLFVFRGAGSEGPWFGGLPAAAAVQIYGLFLLPLLISSFGYAWTFEHSGLKDEDLMALRERFPDSLEIEEPRRRSGSSNS